MAMQCAPWNWTGYTNEQQMEFRDCLNDHMLLVVSIDRVPLEEDFPLLWLPALRENQLVPGYNPANDRAFLLSQYAPIQWQPIQVALSQRWALQQQQQLQQQLQQQQQQQAQMQGYHVAASQPQMLGYDHPQQGEMNEYDMRADQSQAPVGYAHPQHDAVGVQCSQGAYMSVVDPSLSAVDPSLGFAPPQNVASQQHEQTPGWLQDPGLPYDQQRDIIAAATQGAAEQGLYAVSSNGAFSADQTARESGQSHTSSAADDISAEDIWKVDFSAWVDTTQE